MKIVVVGDIHHGPNLEQIDRAIERECPDKTIFLGDCFDQFHDHFDHARRTALWLRESLNKPNRIHLWGNHDMAYGHSKYTCCPGFEPSKERAIRSVLEESDWARLKLWHFEGNWLFSHAGLSTPHVPTDVADIGVFLENAEKAAWAALFSRSAHWIWSVGGARKGLMAAGGLLWCRWEFGFIPVPGINQVVGHTPAGHFRRKYGDRSENWCIDVSSLTGVSRILVLENGVARPVEV